MKTLRSYVLGSFGIAAAGFLAAAPVQAATVDTELQLLVDVSGSIDASEFALQRDGYVQAFQNAVIQALILDTDGGNRIGALAVQLIYWSGAAEQSVAVPWTLIDSVADSNAFAAAIAAAGRPFGGQTAPGSAINFAVSDFLVDNGYEGTWVIDVSGDGEQNDGVDTSDARDAALLAGVDRINGLAIGGAGLVNWYQNNIQGGTDSFTLQAADFDDFAGAVETKLAFEASGTTPTIPLPATAYLLVAGLGGLGALARRRKAARA